MGLCYPEMGLNVAYLGGLLALTVGRCARRYVVGLHATNLYFSYVYVPGMTGPTNSFAARGPVTLTAIVSTASCVKTTHALPTKKLGCHEIETNISNAYEN